MREKYEKRLRKVNECIISAGNSGPPKPLFDEFWRGGELALLFGAAGEGKSILAVQIADALARGRPIGGFQMPNVGRKVLYVDLELSDNQFRTRYSRSDGPAYHFSERLYRDKPPPEKDLCEWLETAVLENGIRVVVIDSLSALKRTHDGIRETLAAMHRLKALRDRLGISILVLTDSIETKYGVEETDLQRSRVLCRVADSVFAIGHNGPDSRYIFQTRSRTTALFWNYRNAPVGQIKRGDDGMPGFEFDDRFLPNIDKHQLSRISKVGTLRDAGATYRMIAKELGIPRSTAHQLYKKWTPAIKSLYASAGGQLPEPPAPLLPEEGWPQAGVVGASGGQLLSEPPASAGGQYQPNESDERDESAWLEEESNVDNGELLPREMDVHAIPFAAGLARRSVYDLKRGYDSYGREIFIESEDAYTGKPMVWYQVMNKKKMFRCERGLWSIDITQLETETFL